MIRCAIIDGTGPEGSAYERAMAKSFCRTLANKLNDQAIYLRGPTAAGMETFDEAVTAFNWLTRQNGPGVELMLAGYSRGGSAAIMTAEMLEANGVDVHSMFLFDPVGRHVFAGGVVIPANVQFSRVARRDQSLSFVMHYEGTMSDSPRLGRTSNPTRPFFDNVGLQWRGSGDHASPTVFKGSHGALGGVGWGFVTEDRLCQINVSSWMGAHMVARGLPISGETPVLGPGDLDPTPPTRAGRVTRVLGQALDAGLLTRSAINRLGGGWTF